MKIAILAESFLPHMNGVTGSILQAIRHLTARGHEILIVAPNAGHVDTDLHGARTVLLKSLPLPGYPEVRIVSASSSKLARVLRDFQPDVVHLASPFVLGWAGIKAANALQIPTVAVYQTDVAAFAAKYGFPQATSAASAHITRLHRRATLTLAPSTSAENFLRKLGVDRLRRWARGVDADRFTPERRDEEWRHSIADGKTLIGYAGRLSPEKQVEDLARLQTVAGSKLVIIGDGPSRHSLEQLMPEAHFTGFLTGDDLGRTLASLDVFVHPGESETFCQGVQEALACGIPVVATGSGGPLDLVENSVTGWLYEPGNLAEMTAYTTDLTGDHAKRQAFARSARRAVRGRSWAALCEQLEEYYFEAIELHEIDRSLLTRSTIRPRSEAAAPRVSLSTQLNSYVALGDSITEGLGDSSRMPTGEHYGWAARLGLLLDRRVSELSSEGHNPTGIPPEPLTHPGMSFANLAVRSRKVSDMADQVDRALELRPDLASMLIGSNDLVGARVNISQLIAQVERQVTRLREADISVLLATPFLPRRAASKLIAKRFARFNEHIRRISLEQDCLLLDIETIPEIGDLQNWCEDRVHLASSGHRILAYRAAAVLGVRDAATLGTLELALHDEEFGPTGGTIRWLRSHALPWMWRRLRGRAAGDGLNAQINDYISLSQVAHKAAHSRPDRHAH